ncbi:hypothetical protein CLU81_5192 [Flavobacterium sp. 9]|uniref:hypothetical protein n=1 Tax=Flavobacterium sp. 9 TaxID=2035198 RepID=UPI000C18F89D|nr:hypothetical protein [Flavobacterium sp. 9]PIF34537.1 hypothetical protein CLU81_5192 [Flavobacterium sp. 9]
MKDIKEKLVQASKAYSDQIVLRAAINAIPQIGGSLDILLSSSGQNFVIKRIEEFVSELSHQIEQLDTSKINYDFFEKEEFYDLIIKAFNSASRTRQSEKLQLYAKIVKGALIEGAEYEEDDPELYLKIIEELSVKELRVAKFLYEIKTLNSTELEEVSKRNGENLNNDAALLSNLYPEFDEDDLISVFVRLERTGLIKEMVGNYFGYAGGLYDITPLFKKLLNFIEKI